jgi:short subunit dehydrogenase-like uncharacterized protein
LRRSSRLALRHVENVRRRVVERVVDETSNGAQRKTRGRLQHPASGSRSGAVAESDRTSFAPCNEVW